MLALGIDIGTTSISAVVLDSENCVIDKRTKPHHAFLSGTPAWERVQDAETLLQAAEAITDSLCARYEVGCIGITGQQHGIVYLDEAGRCLSPLYTWQDGRGNLPFRSGTCAAYLSSETGYAAASGYGLVTHFYNLQNGLVPQGAACICTIHDLFGMRLTGLSRPVTEPSDAQSFGFYDLQNDCFDRDALQKAGIDPGILPEVRRMHILGKTKTGIPVAAAIGDNPASFLGATGGKEHPVLLNIGTGSQISILTQELRQIPPLDTRPYPLGGYLLAGAALCGGRAWAMTERFFSDALFAFTGERRELYAALDRLLDNTPDDGTHPRIRPTFSGTRSDPTLTASVSGLTADGFTPGKFALGMLHGMIGELYGMYRAYLDAGLPPACSLIGSGNGLRLNRHLQRIAAETFSQPLTLSGCPEEAASGAAIYAKKVLTGHMK